MKIKGKITSLLVSALLVTMIVAYTPQTIFNIETTDRGAETKNDGYGLQGPERILLTSGISHDPIHIESDANFTATAELEGWAGDGSESTPFIIEGYDIDREGNDGHCILVENTRLHFIIRDCDITGATVDSRYGILLDNVTNFAIQNNTVRENFNGIRVVGENGTITDNDVVGPIDSVAIGLSQAKNVEIHWNRINDTSHGIYLHTTDWIDVHDNIISDNSNYGIAIVLSNNCTFTDNTCYGMGSGTGTYLHWSEDNYLTRYFVNGTNNGITDNECVNTTVTFSTFQNNDNNIYLQNTIDSHFSYCIIEDAIASGVSSLIGSTNSTIHWSFFRNNPQHATCNSPSPDIEYNHYDDYTGSDVDFDGFGDTPMSFAGSADEKDYNPIVYTSTDIDWSISPTDQFIEYGEVLIYDLDVVSLAPTSSWEISDMTHFIIDSEGTITNRMELDVGVYPIDVTATNLYGFSTEASFTIYVDDTVDPVWISQIVDKSYDYGNSVEIQLSAWDLAGIANWEINDSENFTMSSTAYAEVGIATITASDHLSAGNYSISLTATDTNGNTVSAEFFIVIRAPSMGAIDPFPIFGLAVAVLALIMGTGAFLNTRKKS